MEPANAPSIFLASWPGVTLIESARPRGLCCQKSSQQQKMLTSSNRWFVYATCIFHKLIDQKLVPLSHLVIGGNYLLLVPKNCRKNTYAFLLKHGLLWDKAINTLLLFYIPWKYYQIHSKSHSAVMETHGLEQPTLLRKAPLTGKLLDLRWTTPTGILVSPTIAVEVKTVPSGGQVEHGTMLIV